MSNPWLTAPLSFGRILLLLFSPSICLAAQPISELPLQPDGDRRWVVPAGEYSGQFTIDQPIHLRCEADAVINAGGEGHALTIRSPGVVVESCNIRNWGRNLTRMDSGIFIQPRATGTVIRNNRLKGAGFGVWVDGTDAVELVDNVILGDPTVRSQDRGNGIHLYSVTNAKVVNNWVSQTRDGIYIDTSNQNLIKGNLLEDLRYGVHYMYSHDNRVTGNITRRTRTGYALMQSRKLTVVGNRSHQDENYGILMNYITYSTLRDNVVTGVTRRGTSRESITGSEGKALFIYNSLFNTIENNHFGQSTLGIHLTAGSEDNRISGNSFVMNEQQVKYVATRTQEWSVEGRGNYWSDYLGWDRDSNGLGDIPYEPNDNVDRLLWLYPQVRLLMNSPAIQLLRWVQRAFPVLKSPGVKDSYPLMHMPTADLLNPSPEPTP